MRPVGLIGLHSVLTITRGWPGPYYGGKLEKVRRERIRDLVAMLRGLPDEKLDLGAWFRSNRLVRPKSFCNTIACAGGWASVYPEFEKQGLYAQINGGGMCPLFDITDDRGEEQTLSEFGALREFFGNDQIFSVRHGSDTGDFDSLFPWLSDRELTIKRACAVLERTGIHTGEFYDDRHSYNRLYD